MSTRWELPERGRRGRGAVVLLLALVALAVVAGGGSWLGAQSATFRPTPIALVGRTATVCTLGPATTGSSSTVSTVVTRQAPGRDGTLTGTPVGQTSPSLTLTEQGKGRQLSGQAASLLLEGQGVMATASSGEVFAVGTTGDQRGLMAAPCTAPATEHWFVGVGAESTSRSQLILTNPDDAQAEVDLQFFGARGEVVVPGSPGIVVEAHASRTIALDSLVATAGPLTMSVRATDGRVTAVTRDLRSTALDPAGADWHTSAVAPSRRVVIPGVPEGDGPRQLVVANPGTTRAEVKVEVLSQTGAFAPVGAENVEVAPQSTATVDLAAGLVAQSGAVRLSSDQPVTGSVVATSVRAGAAPDVAVQSATPALIRTGVVALAVAAAGEGEPVESDLVLSNGANTDAMVSLEVLSYEGVSLKTDSVLIGANSTSTRRLAVAAPAYLVIGVPDGSDVHGGVVYTQPDGPVAGLSTASLTSPDVASRAPVVVDDPSVGR